MTSQILHSPFAVVAPTEDGGEGEGDDAECEDRSANVGNHTERFFGQHTAVVLTDFGVGNDTGHYHHTRDGTDNDCVPERTCRRY